MTMCKQIKNILSLEQKPLEEALTVENITDDNDEIPESLKEFYEILYIGMVNEQFSARKLHMIEGILANIVLPALKRN